MFTVKVELTPIGVVKQHHTVGLFETMDAAKTALDHWLAGYNLHVYDTDDLWLSITNFYVAYIRGNPHYHAIAFIEVS